MKTLKFLTVLAAALVASGCATPPAPKSADDGVASRLRADVGSVAPAPGGDAVSAAPVADMKGGTITLNYSGDAATLLRQIAAARGLEFRVTGPQPRMPLFVVLNVNRAPLFDFLREVGGQFGQRADVAPINGKYSNGIELRYRTFN